MVPPRCVPAVLHHEFDIGSQLNIADQGTGKVRVPGFENRVLYKVYFLKLPECQLVKMYHLSDPGKLHQKADDPSMYEFHS